MKEETKKECEQNLKNYQIQLEMLESIKRKTKKDWTNFQNFTQNFESTLWINFKLWMRGDYYDLYYQGQSIEIINYTTDENIIKEIEKKEPERIIKQSYLKDRLKYNVEEFLEKIEREKERRKKIINEYILFLENYEKITNEIENILEPVLWYIKNAPREKYKIKWLIEKTIWTFYNY